MFTLLALSLIGCADPQQAPATPPDAPTQPIVEPPSDVTPPSLLDADPADRADSVPTDAIITLWFDEDIDPPSAAASVELRGRDGALPATVRVDGAVVTLTPDAPLPASSTLSLALKPGLADLAGNLTRQGELLTFATEGRVLGPRHVDPATGHTYQVVWASRDITWERAAEVAALMAAGGEEAHLAVIADAEEAAALVWKIALAVQVM
ncbi:MAG TPA: Ig-like domain-containing protein, partial [Myxococcota bacterium]|nr:Ig-like domain-containing protein [Myxococcota bacterium]